MMGPMPGSFEQFVPEYRKVFLGGGSTNGAALRSSE
jgi:hypothetical protein